MTIVSDIARAAIDFGYHDWKVAILHGIGADGNCTCRKGADCPSPGKHPRQSKWQDCATSDPVAIERLYSKWPDGNVGVRLGPSSGIVDIEYDDAEGEATAERLLSGIVTPTYKSHRSTHRLFAFPTELSIPKAVIKAKGLEMRFGTDEKGAQSVFPPSQHHSGERYRWLDGFSPDDCEPAAFPNCLIELMQSIGDAENTLAHGNGEMLFTMGEDVGELATHPGAATGSRYDTLCQLVGKYLAKYGATSELLTLALAWNQRCSPPKSDGEIGHVVAGLVNKELGKQGSVAQPTQQTAVRPPLSLQTVRYSTIQAELVEWLWPERIALGKLSLIVGEPGLGKTFLSCDMMARVSNGIAWPDGSTCPAGEAAILTAEDGAGDTIRPRLDAHGANVAQVHHIECGLRTDHGKEQFLSLADHITIIDEWLTAHPAVKLFIIDPLSAFYGGKTDSHRDAAIRAVLGPVAKLAEKHRVAIVGIAHLNKSQGKSINRVGGSIGIIAAARAAWLVGADPDDETGRRRLFLKVKNNLGVLGRASGLAYAIEEGRLAWEDDPVLISADEIDSQDEGSPIHEAREWLTAQLELGATESSKLLKRARADGIAERTLRRAKKELGVISFQDLRKWLWRLPEDDSGEQALDEGEGRLIL